MVSLGSGLQPAVLAPDVDHILFKLMLCNETSTSKHGLLLWV